MQSRPICWFSSNFFSNFLCNDIHFDLDLPPYRVAKWISGHISSVKIFQQTFEVLYAQSPFFYWFMKVIAFWLIKTPFSLHLFLYHLIGFVLHLAFNFKHILSSSLACNHIASRSMNPWTQYINPLRFIKLFFLSQFAISGYLLISVYFKTNSVNFFAFTANNF